MEKVTNCNDAFANDCCCVNSGMSCSKSENAHAELRCEAERYFNREYEECKVKDEQLISQESNAKTLCPLEELEVVQRFGLLSDRNTISPLNKRIKGKVFSFNKNDKLAKTLYYNFTNHVNSNGNVTSASKAKKEARLRGHSYSRDKGEKHLLGTRHFCTPPERRTRLLSPSCEPLSCATELTKVQEVHATERIHENECVATLSPTKLLTSDVNEVCSAENLNKCPEIKEEEEQHSINENHKTRMENTYDYVNHDNCRNESNDDKNARLQCTNSLYNTIENMYTTKEKEDEPLYVHQVTTEIMSSKLNSELSPAQILREQGSAHKEQTQRQFIRQELLVESSSDETSVELAVNSFSNEQNNLNEGEKLTSNEEALTLLKSLKVKFDNSQKKELNGVAKRQDRKLSLENVRKRLDDNRKERCSNSTLDIAAEKAKLRLLLCDDSESIMEDAHKEESKEEGWEESNTNVKYNSFELQSLNKCQSHINDTEFVGKTKAELVTNRRLSSAHSTEEKQNRNNIRESNTANSEPYICIQANIKGNNELSSCDNDDDDDDDDDNVKECLPEDVENDTKEVRECIRAKHYNSNNLLTKKDNTWVTLKKWPPEKCKQRKEEDCENECEYYELKQQQELLKSPVLPNKQESKLELQQISPKVIECTDKVENEIDECCICLEEYSADNPKFVSECRHHFHLPCLLSWKQRCNTCPMCNMETIRNVNKEEDAKQEVATESLLSTVILPDTSNDEALARRLQQKYERRERRSKQRNGAERITSTKDNKTENQTANLEIVKWKGQEETHNNPSKERSNRLQSKPVLNEYCKGKGKPDTTKSASIAAFNSRALQSNKLKCQNNQTQQNIFSLTVDDIYAQSARERSRRQRQWEQTHLPLPQQTSLQTSKIICKDVEKSKPCTIM